MEEAFMKKNIATKPFICGLFLTFFTVFSISSLEVARDELESADAAAVVFENYTGPHSVIDSLDSIKGIGASLGKELSNPSEKSSIGIGQRYSVIHAVDVSVKEKLDADILIISSDATVDHIDNLRRIISSYLSSAYHYSEKDADTLSVFVTVYNAVYRGKLDAFTAKYKTIVTENLTAEKVGLALSYTEWPGNSQIIIPLSEPVSGGLSTIDTSIISSDEVVSSMREENDKGIDARKDMVEIKEKEAAQATEKAQVAQKTVTDEQKQLKENQEKLPEAKKEAAEAQKAAEADPENEELQQQAQEKQDEVKNIEQNIEQNKTNIDESTKTAAEQQLKADKKSTEAVEERESIAKDQQTIVNENIQNSNAPVVYGLRLVNEKKQLSALVKVNANTGDLIDESPVTVLRNRTVYQADSNYIAIAGENSGNGAIKIVMLNNEQMEIIAESNEMIADGSVLVQNGNYLYCVIVDGKKNYVAKYDNSLNLLAKSKDEVNNLTPITVTGNQICVTNAKGQITLLSADDLSAIGK